MPTCPLFREAPGAGSAKPRAPIVFGWLRLKLLRHPGPNSQARGSRRTRRKCSRDQYGGRLERRGLAARIDHRAREHVGFREIGHRITAADVEAIDGHTL